MNKPLLKKSTIWIQFLHGAFGGGALLLPFYGAMGQGITHVTKIFVIQQLNLALQLIPTSLALLGVYYLLTDLQQKLLAQPHSILLHEKDIGDQKFLKNRPNHDNIKLLKTSAQPNIAAQKISDSEPNFSGEGNYQYLSDKNKKQAEMACLLEVNSPGKAQVEGNILSCLPHLGASQTLNNQPVCPPDLSEHTSGKTTDIGQKETSLIFIRDHANTVKVLVYEFAPETITFGYLQAAQYQYSWLEHISGNAHKALSIKGLFHSVNEADFLESCVNASTPEKQLSAAGPTGFESTVQACAISKPTNPVTETSPWLAGILDRRRKLKQTQLAGEKIRKSGQLTEISPAEMTDLIDNQD